MNKKDFSKIAGAGLLSGAVFLNACQQKRENAKELVKQSGYDLSTISATFVDGGFSAVHSCAGLNICKGLGGCSVSDEKLAKLAEKMNIDIGKAGEAHSCAGLNECKGLGGCKVSAEKFIKLKQKQLAKEVN